jgi:hypothetical protein
MAPIITDNRPLFDFFQRPKAADADEVIIQATISHTRRLSGAVDVGH